MSTRGLGITALAATALLIGCGPSPDEDAFAQSLRDYGGIWLHLDEATAIELGQTICDFHDSADGEPDLHRATAIALLQDTPLDLQQSAQMYASAITSLCPEHS